MTATLTAKAVSFQGRVKMDTPVETTARSEVSRITLLKFGVRSRYMLRMNEPITPKMMKMPPQIPLNTD